MMYREIIAICSQIHTKHINTLCGQNVELLNVKLAVHALSNSINECYSLSYSCLIAASLYANESLGSKFQMLRTLTIRRVQCHSRNAISITYSECVSVALVIQHATRMRHIVICSLPR